MLEDAAPCLPSPPPVREWLQGNRPINQTVPPIVILVPTISTGCVRVSTPGTQEFRVMRVLVLTVAAYPTDVLGRARRGGNDGATRPGTPPRWGFLAAAVVGLSECGLVLESSLIECRLSSVQCIVSPR